MKKARFQAQKAVQEILCDLPYTVAIDYSDEGQNGHMPADYQAKVPGHFMDVVIKQALQKAWAEGYMAGMSHHTLEIKIDEKLVMKHVRKYIKDHVRANGRLKVVR